jgi:hypothetical protein
VVSTAFWKSSALKTREAPANPPLQTDGRLGHFAPSCVCVGVPPAAGSEAASDITAEFAQHRRWFSNVACRWDGERLVLEADSDVDSDGAALADEFSDCVSAYVAGEFDSTISVESVVKLGER